MENIVSCISAPVRGIDKLDGALMQMLDESVSNRVTNGLNGWKMRMVLPWHAVLTALPKQDRCVLLGVLLGAFVWYFCAAAIVMMPIYYTWMWATDRVRLSAHIVFVASPFIVELRIRGAVGKEAVLKFDVSTTSVPSVPLDPVDRDSPANPTEDVLTVEVSPCYRHSFTICSKPSPYRVAYAPLLRPHAHVRQILPPTLVIEESEETTSASDSLPVIEESEEDETLASSCSGGTPGWVPPRR